MSLVGNLEDLSLPDILQIVSLSKKSGILMVEREGQQGKIFIRQGKVIQTVSPRPGKTLGEILIAKELIKPEDLKKALEIQRSGGGRELLGSILVKQKFLDEPTLEKIVHEQIEDAIVFFLSWREGTFSFELADIQSRGEFSVDPQAFILERGIDTQWLVLEGTRLIDERAREKEKAVPAEVAPAATPETSFADVEASPEEKRGLILVDDDPIFSDLARVNFERLGFRVTTCEGVVEGWRVTEELARQIPPPVVVADIVMPTADNRGFLGGLDLVEKIRRAHPEIAVAAVTAYLDENVRAKVGECGGRFFLKPSGRTGGEAELRLFFEQVTAELTGGRMANAAAAAGTPVAKATAAAVAERTEREKALSALKETESALARQEQTVKAAGLGRDEMPLLRDMLEELQNPRATSEIGLLILRFAAELMNRAVLFVVKGGKAIGLGGFGVEVSGTEPRKGIRGIAIPLDQPSLLEEVVQRRAPYHGPVVHTPWNRILLDQLGGKTPVEAVALPLLSGGKVRVILYGDNLPEEKPLAGIHALEIFLTQAGLTLERVLLEKKLQATEGPPGPEGARREQKVGGRTR